jgi:hypothetical protein
MTAPCTNCVFPSLPSLQTLPRWTKGALEELYDSTPGAVALPNPPQEPLQVGVTLLAIFARQVLSSFGPHTVDMMLGSVEGTDHQPGCAVPLVHAWWPS